MNANSQPTVQQKPNDVNVEAEEEEETRDTQPIHVNELDRLENVLAQHQQEGEVDYNNNNIEQVGHEYELHNYFIANQQQQQSDSNFVIPNENEDFSKQLADLADGQILNVELEEFEENEHANKEEAQDDDKENVPQAFFFKLLTPSKTEKVLTKTSRSINNLSISTTNQQSNIKLTKSSASSNDIGEVTEKRCCSLS